MGKLAFDTSTIILFDGRTASDDRGERFVKHSVKERLVWVIPAPALFEYIRGVYPIDQRGAALQRFTDRAIIAQVTPRATMIAAELIDVIPRGPEDRCKACGRGPRSRLAMDALIAGVAIDAGCDTLYTENRNDFDRLALAGRLRIEPLPSVPAPGVLPGF